MAVRSMRRVIVLTAGAMSVVASLTLSARPTLPAALSAPAQAQAPAQTPAGGRGRGMMADPWPDKPKLLAVADVLTGFHHDSISHALATVERIGRESGAYVTIIRTDSQLITKSPVAGQGRYEGRGVNARTLDFYDAIFLLPSGFGTMSDQQKQDLLSFVRDDGKGLVVGHAAGVAFTNWPEFGELMGGYMDSEFTADARVIVEDPAFPGADAFGLPSFTFNDQHPVFTDPYSRKDVRVILRLDPASLSDANRARRPDGDFPVAWARADGKGRVFNMGWGHPDTTWDDPRFQKLMLEAIRWAMGQTSADVTPRPLER